MCSLMMYKVKKNKKNLRSLRKKIKPSYCLLVATLKENRLLVKLQMTYITVLLTSVKYTVIHDHPCIQSLFQNQTLTNH
jgi:hypothetical protein